MNYLIHNSVEQMLVEAENAPDLEAARKKYANESIYIKYDMKGSWDYWTKGTAFNGETGKVIAYVYTMTEVMKTFLSYWDVHNKKIVMDAIRIPLSYSK